MAYDDEAANDYFRSQGLVLNAEGTEWVNPSTPESSEPSPAEIAAYRVARGVKHSNPLPVQDDRGSPFSGPADPARPSYIMEPDLQEAQGGMHLPPGLMQEDSGRFYYQDDPAKTVPMVQRPGLVPFANTPEGYKLVMPKMLDLVGNVMGNVAAPRVAAKAGEMVLGSGAMRTVQEAKYPLASPAERHSNAMNDNLIQYMTPDEFLKKSRPLKIDESSRENIDILKKHIEEGKPLDPLELQSNGKEDGRHRAIAAKELGIKEVPVINFRNEKAEPFYSQLERTVQQAKINLATPEQWLGYLKNQPGVKSEELSSVLGSLSNEKGMLSKSQLEDVVKQNKVELKEKILGDSEHYQLHYKDTLPRRLTLFGPVLDEIKDVSDIALAKRHNSSFRETVKNVGDLKAFEAVQEAKKLPNFDKQLGQFDTRKEAEEAIKNLKGDEHIDIAHKRNNIETKYHAYQLPGGENYKEMLLSLPAKESKFDASQVEITRNMQSQTQGTTSIWYGGKKIMTYSDDPILQPHGGYDQRPKSYWMDIAKKLYDEGDKINKVPSRSENFKAPHFDDNGTNLLAHIRMNDRYLKQTGYSVENQVSKNARMFGSKEEAEAFVNTLPDNLKGKIKIKEIEGGHSKKTLHLEEIQSDWHQGGRKQGYKGEKEKLEPEFNKIEKKIVDSNDETIMGQPKIEDALKLAVEKKLITKSEADTYKRYTDIENGKPVPDAPFKKTWDELALKRMIHKAASEGYEGLSWTPGEAQALRYPDALRQQVNSIDWAPRPKHLEKFHSDDLIDHIDLKDKDIKHVVVNGKTDRMWFNVDNKGNIVSASHKDAKDKKLDEVIGKQMSQQILEKEKGEIDAKDFVMGAEGMKGFYDKMLVDKANAIGKKYGSKVEQREIGVAKGKPTTFPSFGHWKDAPDEVKHKIHYLPITPELRAKAKEGFPLFSSVNPTLVPVDTPPEFKDKNAGSSKVKLIPVQGNPFEQ